MNAQGTPGGRSMIARFVVQRIVLVALATALILGLYPALLGALAPAVP